MTPKELKALGYREFSWNSGAIMEYWKPLSLDEDFTYRIGVRFGAWKHIPFEVFIWSSLGGLCLKHIKTAEQVEMLYNLLREPEVG